MVGNKTWMATNNITVPEETTSKKIEMSKKGWTAVLVAINDQVVAVVGIADKLKPGSKYVVEYFHSVGIEVKMITGDNSVTAHTIGALIGLHPESIHAEMKPDGKSEIVKDAQARGLVTIFVGDGINDAPSLAQADVGIAIGSGTDVAVESAKVVLMQSRIEDAVTAIDLSATFWRIKMNFFWALFYNCSAIPVAGGGLYWYKHFILPPWLAGVCMGMSSLCVVMSSLMLRFYTPPAVALMDHSSENLQVSKSSSKPNLNRRATLAETNKFTSGSNRRVFDPTMDHSIRQLNRPSAKFVGSDGKFGADMLKHATEDALLVG